VRLTLANLPPIASHLAAFCLGSALIRLSGTPNTEGDSTQFSLSKPGIYLVIPKHKLSSGVKLNAPEKIHVGLKGLKPCKLTTAPIWALSRAKSVVLQINKTEDLQGMTQNLSTHGHLTIYPTEPPLEACSHEPKVNYLDH